MAPDPAPHRLTPITRPLPCKEGGCGKPYLFLEDDVLVILSRHGGETHRNTISLFRLAELAGLRLVPGEPVGYNETGGSV